MVPQEQTSQKQAEQPRQRIAIRHDLRLTAPLGFLGLIVVLAWASWPGAGLLNLSTVPAAELRTADPAATIKTVDDVSLAVVNPENVPASQVTAGPQILPVNDETGESSEENGTTGTAPQNDADGLERIIIVTPTPDPSDIPALESPAQVTDATQDASGVVLAGQSLQPSSVTPSSGVDNATLSELLAPLLEEQIDPKPLVIELEIPSGSAASSSNIFSRSNLAVPSQGTAAFPQVMLLPTATATPAPDRGSPSAADIPLVEIVPAVGVRFTPTPTPAPTATPVPQPTALWAATGPVPGRLWSTFEPRPAESSDHFWLGNPFEGVAGNSFASPNYQFGSTAGGRYRPHHGIDISNPTGTPIRAGVKGEVIFAGPDDVQALGPYSGFYGNAVVIRLDRRLPVAGGRLDVFVLYGHLSDVRATVGQRVEPTDIVGLVGMTGIAIGPHLHVEVRLGANTYSHNVNPYLWMEPRPGSGAVAVRLLTSDGRTWAGAKLSIARFEGGAAVWARQIETYLDTENIGPDPAWGENGAMGDVPAGYYYLIGKVNGENVRAEFPVQAGQTTFIEVRTLQ